MPGDSENIVSMEKFGGALKSVTCTPQGVTIQFIDNAAFAYAQKVWDWVNGADNHTFVLVVGAGDCGDNTHRQPYLVSSIAYEEGHDTAYLAATAEDWKTVLHSYDLQVGHVPLPGDGGVLPRDITQDLSLPVAASLPFSVSIPVGDFTTTLACSGCGITGSFNLELTISMAGLVPTDATVRMAPKGVSVTVNLTLTESGTLQGFKPFDLNPFLTLPLDAIVIPGGIVDIGPTLDFNFGLALSDISGSASIGTGVTASLPDSAIVEIDLLNPSNNNFSGWMPSVTSFPITVTDQISGGVSVYLQESLDLTAAALGQGYQFGLKFQMPTLGASLSIAAPPSAPCPAGTSLGVQLNDITVGADLTLQAASLATKDEPFLNVTLAAVSNPLKSQCLPLGN